MWGEIMNELKFRNLSTANQPLASTSECIQRAVTTSPDYYDGQMESLQRKVDKLTDILATLVSLSPEDVQKQIVESNCWGYEVVEVKS